MNTQIRTYETQNNTYHIIKTAKTTYEQQREDRKDKLLLICQKLLGVIIVALAILFTKHTGDGTVLIITGLIGLVCILSNKVIFN